MLVYNPIDSQCLGSTSTTVNFNPCSSTTNVRPVGCRNVNGEKSTSASAGKAETHESSAPRSMKELVLTWTKGGGGEEW